MTTQVEAFTKLIRQGIPVHGSVKDAADAVRKNLEDIFGELSPDQEKELDDALVAVEASQQSVEIIRRSSLVKVRDDWYTGPIAGDRHWPAVKGYLDNTKNWDHEAVESIDESSKEVVSLLANPAKDQFRCRGLVVGYVQSGKTANMTAVIAKAVDAGYNLVVVLGGVTNKLRVQTQRRLEGDIVHRNSHLWQLYTTSEEGGDFTKPPNGQFTMPVPGRAQLAVMKKITSRLNAFLRTIERTSPPILKSLKTLIIDDECDQASVNSSSDDYDMTRTNEVIRKIIRALPAVSYVGYTATPFANVFIDPFPYNKDELDDLYPEDFITDLPRPKGYFGAREVFGFDPDDAENEDDASEGLDMIRTIPAAEVAEIRPATANANATFVPRITGELERTLLWFLLSCAVRRRRGQGGSHMTMLVHASSRINQHERLAQAIRVWLANHKAAIFSKNGPVWSTLIELWRDETRRMPLENESDIDLVPSELIPELREVCDALDVIVENSQSLERLDYSEEPTTCIVVGGSILSRGLTLEGLAVSFFLRTSRQYDTLLQMGRWFGFRPGYADLPRLWTTSDLVANFRALARIEEEIREDISVYRKMDATPLTFAMKVRAIPGMAITGAAKMRHARKTSISFEGKHVQTIRFDHRSNSIVSGNWVAASHLVDNAKAHGAHDHGSRLFTKVPLSDIRKFLMEFRISDQHLDLKSEMLLNYLDKVAAELDLWNVVVVCPKNGAPSAHPLGFMGSVATNRRSKLATAGDYADIKALMSKRDILADADDKTIQDDESWDDLKARRPDMPLLLLYPIAAQSQPARNVSSASGRPGRVALDAVDDLVGVGLVFPGSVNRSGSHFAVDLDVPTPEQLDGEDPMEDEGA